MGATVEVVENEYRVSAPNGLRGTDIFFRWVSVTATETLMMAAILAKGTTTLRNVAMEPEVVDLAAFLVSAGAKITGIGTPTLTIEGGGMLEPIKPHRVIPDRIETGSFLILGALLARELRITHCKPEHVRMLIELLSHSGVHILEEKDSLVIKNAGETRQKPAHRDTFCCSMASLQREQRFRSRASCPTVKSHLQQRAHFLAPDSCAGRTSTPNPPEPGSWRSDT
jgi:UDP-N-acetylglucosamine enolpyruvyl transferase